ncbi:MAG: ATP-dependent DNA helicase RecG [Planctomycetaceae bacterium]|nr:ATP-dependent DNA helicase RecG [Planctomycetaceae bacterium]
MSLDDKRHYVYNPQNIFDYDQSDNGCNFPIAMTTSQPDSISLKQTVDTLQGVTPLRLEQLHRLEIYRVFDLLFNFPRDYDDLTNRRCVSQLEPQKLQTVLGVIDTWNTKSTRRGPCTTLDVNCGDGYVKAIWFNMPFIARGFSVDRRVLLSGKPRDEHPYWVMSHPTLTFLGDDEDPETALSPFLPIYPLTEGMTQPVLRRLIKQVIGKYTELLDEVFPADYLTEHNLMPIREAVANIHFPPDLETMQLARRRFVYQELFVLQLALAQRRLQHHALLKAPPLVVNDAIDNAVRKLFPFELTAAQKRVIKEIAADMAGQIPMNRLLQGDVGSGKTVVAIYAMLLAKHYGYQSVFMAPTEVLARQHLRTLIRYLENTDVHITPLFGGQRQSERSQALREIAAGWSSIIVGTQAIICSEVPFSKLGLVVIDEQHKFGVRQRAALKTASNFDPHYLVMTATPIPRSVTMTLFGDLDVSTMRELPPGRQKVTTYLTRPDQRHQWWEFVTRKLNAGQQGYVVVPLVEDSENLEVQSIREVHDALKQGELREFRLGMIHGRMSTDEKEQIMKNFRTGEIQMLVATTVIEVGVDVPNANLLTIENGERFGLAQLHQLRGRIGRGKHPGFCAVFANPTSVDSEKRLKAFEKTNDGFKLAEKDFELRGSGDLFGTAQHGMPPMKVANLVKDQEILLEARQDAVTMVKNNPGLSNPEHAKLRQQMLTRYGKVLELGDVG